MKYFYNQIFADKCEIHALPTGELVYPIFKNGSSIIRDTSVKVYINQQIKKLDTITVYLREAEQRYRVGVSTFISHHQNLDTYTLLELINSGQLLNSHFASQYMWLQNLKRFSPAHSIIIRDYSDIPIDRIKASSKNIKLHDIEIPHGWCELDNIVYNKFINKTVTLKSIDKYLQTDHRMLYKRCIALD